MSSMRPPIAFTSRSLSWRAFAAALNSRSPAPLPKSGASATRVPPMLQAARNDEWMAAGIAPAWGWVDMTDSQNGPARGMGVIGGSRLRRTDGDR